jgi:hypothetical protein
MDPNKDGTVTKNELRNLYKGMGHIVDDKVID